MKRQYIIISLLLALLSTTSCKNEDTTMFASPAGVYFDNDSTLYSFAENFNNKEWGSDTIKLFIGISGDPVPYARPISVTLHEDSFNTAKTEMFDFLQGEIPADSLNGIIPVKLNYTGAEMDSVQYKFKVRLVPNEHFAETDLFKHIHKIYVTAMMTQPINWKKVKKYFGNYSNSWYSFILTQFEMSYIPYWTGKNNPDPEKYNMPNNTFQAYVNKVRVALDEYNQTHDTPLLHEDGEFKGLPVTMN